MNFGHIRRSLRKLSWWGRPASWNLLFGNRGERVAAGYLVRQGLRILARNYSCAAGEIDLICADGDFLVFVEVKTLASSEARPPEEAVRPQQWRRIERTARHFLMQHAADERPCRFDLALVSWPTGGRPSVEHFEDAYQPRPP